MLDKEKLKKMCCVDCCNCWHTFLWYTWSLEQLT